MSELVPLVARTAAIASSGALPLVVFDLDSTLFSTGERHRRILAEFAARHGDPGLQTLVDGLSPRDFRWSVLGPLQRAGWDDPALHKAVMKAWSKAFFSDRMADVDLLVRGAHGFVHAVADAGALCVYLTGRDAPGMGAGTLRLLHRAGLPLLDGHGLAMLKASTSAADAAHKQDAAARLRALGTVVATFENEPGHANDFLAAFPEGTHVLVGDVHRPGAPDPDPALVCVEDFRGPWEA